MFLVHWVSAAQCPLEKCGKTISRPRDLLLHISATHRENHMWYCIVCEVFFPRVSDLVRHDFYVHSLPKWSDSSHFTTAKFEKKEKPLAFNAKKYQRGLNKAGLAIKVVAPKRRADGIADNVVKEKLKLSQETAGPVLALRSVPIPVDVEEEVATIDELLAGMNDEDIDDYTLTELLAGDSDSLDTVISGSDVDEFFETTENTPASDDDTNHVVIDVTEVSVKEEADDDLQFERYYSKSEKQMEEGLVIAREKVGSLEEEVSKGRDKLDVQKIEWEEYISSLTAQCDGLRKEHDDLRKIALGCEGRLKESDQRYKRLVESLNKADHHPKRSPTL